MPELKKYVKKQDFDVEAYQVNPKARDRDTLQLNQSGYYEPAYHGMLTTSHISWVEPGDYVVKLPNDMWTAVKKDDFERMYEVVEPKKMIESFPEEIQEEVAPTGTVCVKLDEDPNEKVAVKKPTKKKSYKD